MSAVASALSVGWLVASLAAGYLLISTDGIRSWAATSAGRSWTRRVGALAAVVAVVSVGAFPVDPPLAVYLLVVAGVVAAAAGTLAAAGAADTALRATRLHSEFARLVRAFWYAAGVHYRGTRYGFGLSLAAFLLGAVAAGVSVDPLVTAAGGVALGGALAVLVALAAVGVFVPAARNQSVAAAVERAV